MNLKISGTSKMLLLSVAFCMSLLLVRFAYSNDTIAYSFMDGILSWRPSLTWRVHN
jgi:hypothetical protein